MNSAIPRRSPSSAKDLIARTEARIADMLEAGGRAFTALARSAAGHRRWRRVDPRQGARSAGSKCVKPNHFAVANAVGAAIAQVSGEVDRVYSLAVDVARRRDQGRDARRRPPSPFPPAPAAARSKSSTSRTCRSPISQATRRACMSKWWEISMPRDAFPVRRGGPPAALARRRAARHGRRRQSLYRHAAAARVAAQGAPVVSVLPLEALTTTTFVGSVGGIGAPVVGIEKIKQGDECLRALRGVEEAAGIKCLRRSSPPRSAAPIRSSRC